MKATIRDRFVDTGGRQFEAEWSFRADRPLVVELTLIPRGGGDLQTWVIDRSRLPWSLFGRGGVSLGASGPRLIVILRPMTIHSVTMRSTWARPRGSWRRRAVSCRCAWLRNAAGTVSNVVCWRWRPCGTRCGAQRDGRRRTDTVAGGDSRIGVRADGRARGGGTS